MKYPSQNDRTYIAIRKRTKKAFDRKAKKAKLRAIDFIDKLVLFDKQV